MNARLIALALAGVAVWPQLAAAQPVVQPLPGPEAGRLSEALRTLARDPNSLPALLSAGQASLALDDPDAAFGFFTRVQAIAPQDGQAKAGVAGVLLRRAQPVDALRLYAEAEQTGVAMAPYAADRGLAYDLVGDNARAQASYRLALSQGDDAVITQRLALSQAMSGDQAAAEATLLPLLQKQDLGAFRTRAFALAILGKSTEAVSIAETMLPTALSNRLGPYLRYMPRLTRAQQAAAANLGAFPSAGDIGRDPPAILAYSGATAPQLAQNGADARLVPSGAPLGTDATPQRELDPVAPVVAAAAPVATPPAPVVVARAAPVSTPGATPAPTSTFATRVAPVTAQPPARTGVVPVAAVSASTPAPAPVQVAPVQPAPVPAAPVQVALAPAAPLPPPPSRMGLADAFAEFRQVGGSPAIIVPPVNAVDITKIEPRRDPPPAPAAKPAPPPVPSRHWVQIATGRDTSALAFDWRRIKREAGGLLDRNSPNTARWGQTNRLVVGPFPTTRAADELIGKLKDKKVDSFRFTSATGEEVKPLS